MRRLIVADDRKACGGSWAGIRHELNLQTRYFFIRSLIAWSIGSPLDRYHSSDSGTQRNRDWRNSLGRGLAVLRTDGP